MTETTNALNPAELLKRNALKDSKPYVYEKIQKYAAKVDKGESIAIVQLQYDYTCNFRCEHCSISKFRWKAKTGDRSLTVADVRELARQADEMGLAHFVITGGEPLLFPDFDEIVAAIDPQRFYITSDTNGWLLDEAKAKHLKSIGLDKLQISIDSLSAENHDTFRRQKHSFERAMKGVDAAVASGINTIIATVLTKGRSRAPEFIEMLEYAKKKGIGVYVTYAKPVGAWEGHYESLVTDDDVARIRELEKQYNVFTHLTPGYGLNLGCIAVKRMVSVTKYGDVMPCPYIHITLGNIFKEPLKVIVERGMKIKAFGLHTDKCLAGEDMDFIRNKMEKTYGRPLPVPYQDIFTDDDMIT